MPTTDEICARLVAAQLTTRDRIDALLLQWRQAGDGATEEFLNWLVNEKVVTSFQAEAVREGHIGPFVLGPYRMFEEIAAGRLGSLFRAVHVEFDQPVTLKVFPATLANDANLAARLSRELRVTVELDHPHVVRSFQIGHVGEIYYLALEDLRGETLEQLLNREGFLPFDKALQLASEIARGLEHLHANEVVHRDLRPRNIWITQSGQAKIMEFSAARDALAWLDSSGDAASGDSLGSESSLVSEDYLYMAPEQSENPRQADARSDIYSLGCVLYEMLASHPPFQDSNVVRLAVKHARATPQPLSELVADVTHPFDETMDAMLAKDPDRRFQTAADVAEALISYLPELPSDGMDVVHYSPQYLEWLKQQHPDRTISHEAVGITPELTNFLHWISKQPLR